MPRREPGARTHLALVARGKGDGDPRGDHRRATGSEQDGGVHARGEVEPRNSFLAALWCAGEGNHEGHHDQPTSPRFRGPYPDTAWWAIRLLMAFRLQERAAGVGFDWPDARGPMEKVKEEIGELEREIATERPAPGSPLTCPPSPPSTI